MEGLIRAARSSFSPPIQKAVVVRKSNISDCSIQLHCSVNGPKASIFGARNIKKEHQQPWKKNDSGQQPAGQLRILRLTFLRSMLNRNGVAEKRELFSRNPQPNPQRYAVPHSWSLPSLPLSQPTSHNDNDDEKPTAWRSRAAWR